MNKASFWHVDARLPDMFIAARNANGQKCISAVDFRMLMAIHANAIVLKVCPSETAR